LLTVQTVVSGHPVYFVKNSLVNKYHTTVMRDDCVVMVACWNIVTVFQLWINVCFFLKLRCPIMMSCIGFIFLWQNLSTGRPLVPFILSTVGCFC